MIIYNYSLESIKVHLRVFLERFPVSVSMFAMGRTRLPLGTKSRGTCLYKTRVGNG